MVISEVDPRGGGLLTLPQLQQIYDFTTIKCVHGMNAPTVGIPMDAIHL
jgi:hypothetical protein